MVDRITLTGSVTDADGNAIIYSGFKSTMTATLEGEADAEGNRKSASKKTVTWSAAGTGATIDESTGVLTVAAGTAKDTEITVTATSVNGADGATVKGTLTVKVAEPKTAEIARDTATMANVGVTGVSSNDESIATGALSDDGKKIVITPVAEGKTEVYGEGKTVVVSGGTASLKTCAAVIPVTVSEDGIITLGDVSTTVLAPTVNLFKYANSSANLTDTVIKRADSNYVTISNPTFAYTTGTNIPGQDDNASGLKKVNSATYGTNAAQYGFVAKTVNSGNNYTGFGKNSVVATATFTVTPSSSVKLAKVSGTVRNAASDAYGIRVKIDDVATADDLLAADADNHTNKVATFETEIAKPAATSSAFTVKIELVTTAQVEKDDGTNNASIKKNTQLDLYDVTLTFAPDDE